jgi:SAM-dependent methyltransferase
MRPLWLLDTIGSRLIQEEQEELVDVLAISNGDGFLQIGIWGHSKTFTNHLHADEFFLVEQGVIEGVNLVAKFDHLPIKDQVIDVVFLPHTLEQVKVNQPILNSTTELLKDGGKLIAIGFNPFSLWGLRHYLSGKRFLLGMNQLISVKRYTTWLIDLGFRIEKIHYFHATLPTVKRYDLPLKINIFNPFLCACYMIVANKERIPMTLEKQFTRDGYKQSGSLADSMSRVIE